MEKESFENNLDEEAKLAEENKQNKEPFHTCKFAYFYFMRFLQILQYRVFHNNLPKIMAYYSKIKSPGDFLGLWAANQIWSI